MGRRNEPLSHFSQNPSDIMLGREEVYPAAEILVQRGIGFVFHSGHATGLDLKARFPDAPVCSKTAAPGELVRLLPEVHASARPR